MLFEEGYIYHIYNQGNNRQKIFFNRENYIYFLRKVRTYILPYADILAWCLMPNHFHLMVKVNRLGVSLRHTESDTGSKSRTFNDSIGIMLMSYTKAINKQQNRSGKLFREATKAECVNCPQGLTPSFVMINGITTYLNPDGSKDYPQTCFRYIHQNPVKAKLVKKAEDWEFSSASDYLGLRNGNLINKKTANIYVDTSLIQ
jgi:putative transposase